MKKKEFNSLLKQVSIPTPNGRKICKDKAYALDDQTKDQVVKFLVRHRHEILVEFLGGSYYTEEYRAWLAAMGYMYHYESGGYNFLGKMEHKLNAKGSVGLV